MPLENLKRLEAHTRRLAAALSDSTLPDAVKEAASANLSTLASTTWFRTANGELNGFQGVNDKAGCCFGNCMHVWNHEPPAVPLFPSLARSLRKGLVRFLDGRRRRYSFPSIAS